MGARCNESWKGDKKSSVVDQNCITLQDLFCFRVKITCHFMDMIFLLTAGTAQSDATALAEDFQFFLAFSTFHNKRVSAEELFTGKESF